jgi:hypothetical protein
VNVMKAYGEVEVYLQAFLTSALEEGEWLASRSRINPGERSPCNTQRLSGRFG